MKKSRFCDSPILAVHKQAGGGVAVPELCREDGMSHATFYRWREIFDGMDASIMEQARHVR